MTKNDWFALFLGMLTGVFLMSVVARAHDGYEGVLNNDGVSCCNNFDCKPISEEQVVPQKDGSYLVPQIRTIVPKENVIPTPAHLVSKSLYHLCCLRDREAQTGEAAYYCTCLMVPLGY